MTEIKVGQIWRRKADGTLVEVRRLEGQTVTAFFTPRLDVSYRRIGVKGVGTSQCYADQFVNRYELVEEVS